MLQRFTARRYRNVDVEGLELGRLNVLVGPNNSGKSNFIRAIRFLHHLLIPRDPKNAFLSALNTRGRGDLLARGVAVPGDIDLAWTLAPKPGTKALTYEISFQVGENDAFPSGFYVTKERLGEARGAEASHWFLERDATSPEKVSVPGVGSFEASSQETMLQQFDRAGVAAAFVPPSLQLVQQTVRDLKEYLDGLHAYDLRSDRSGGGREGGAA